MNKKLEFAPADYERFRNLILERNGLYFPEDKRQALRKGLAEALEASLCASLDEYYDLLRRSPSNSSEWERLASELTVGETYFFRNKGHFDALAKHILPEIIAQRKHFKRRIRIWSAGCASGEEPYSVAILLHELIPNLERWHILILATDINRCALRKAQEGLYGLWSFRRLEKRIQDRYFRLDGHKQFVISDEIKDMVTFDYLNLIGDTYPSLSNNTIAMDVILCRNVTIYFSPEVIQQVVNRFHNCLTDGGWLIPGASEPNMVFYQDFEPKSFPNAVVYQKPAVAKAKTRPAPVVKESKPEPLPGFTDGKEKSLPLSDPYRVALELLSVSRMDEALVKLYEKLGQDPDFVPTYYTLGKIYADKGDLEEAQHWCERAIKKDKLYPEPYYTLSTIYQQHGRLDMAIDALKKTVYLDREFVLAHFSLANIYRQQGKARLARKSLQNVQRLLEGKPMTEPVPKGDGMLVGRLLQQVEAELANGEDVKRDG